MRLDTGQANLFVKLEKERQAEREREQRSQHGKICHQCWRYQKEGEFKCGFVKSKPLLLKHLSRRHSLSLPLPLSRVTFEIFMVHAESASSRQCPFCIMTSKNISHKRRERMSTERSRKLRKKKKNEQHQSWQKCSKAAASPARLVLKCKFVHQLC